MRKEVTGGSYQNLIMQFPSGLSDMMIRLVFHPAFLLYTTIILAQKDIIK
jgi:hypothetical protein